MKKFNICFNFVKISFLEDYGMKDSNFTPKEAGNQHSILSKDYLQISQMMAHLLL